MELLEERIRRDGVVKSEGVLKVDSFLNHQLDIDLFDAMGEEFKRLFADAPITKILTIEASGIGIACVVARHFGVPVVFAKKAQSINLDGEMFTTRIESFTHGRVYDVIVSKKFLNADDHVLIIDDFLANGCALNGLIELVGEAGFSQRNILIAALSLAVGIGFTQVSALFANFPELIQSVFAQNCVAVVFLVAVVANLVLPKDAGIEGATAMSERSTAEAAPSVDEDGDLATA